MQSEIMTAKEAAAYLQLHLVTIYRLLKKNQIPAAKIGGLWRFHKSVLDAWVEGKAEANPNSKIYRSHDHNEQN